jgi:hypothetical protein
MPLSEPGYYLAEAPRSVLDLCDAKLLKLWESQICGYGEIAKENGVCEKDYRWSVDMIYMCLNSLQMYECPSGPAACVGGQGTPNSSLACHSGYEGPLCDLCSDGYYKTSGGSCLACSGASAKGSQGGTMAFYSIIFAASGLVLAVMIFVYLHDTASLTLAEKLGKLKLILCPCIHESKEHRDKMQFMIENDPHLMAHEQENKYVRPEKFKIMLAFFQVFSQFKNNYNIRWPKAVTEYMRQFASFNFEIFKLIGVGCIAKLNFYNTLTMYTFGPLLMLVFIAFLYKFGEHWYHRRLKKWARRCADCGRQVHHNRDIEEQERQIKEDLDEGRPWKPFELHCIDCPRSFGAHSDKYDTHKKVLAYNMIAFHNRVLTRINMRIYHNKVIKLLFWLMLLAYPPVSTTTLKVFSCSDFGKKKFLSSDYSLECYTDEWYKYAGYASIGVLVYIIGIPVTFFFVIRYCKNQDVDQKLRRVFGEGNEHLVTHYLDCVRYEREAREKSFIPPKDAKTQKRILRYHFQMENLRNHWNRARIGFIYFSYEEHLWWYEIFELFRKLLLNGVIVFIGKGSLAQIIISAFICIFALYTALNIKPYQDDTDDLLANMCLAQLFISLFLGLFVRLHTDSNQVAPPWVSMLIIGTNAVVLIAGLTLVVNEKFSSMVGLNRAYRKRQKILMKKRRAKKSWGALSGSSNNRKQKSHFFSQMQISKLKVAPVASSQNFGDWESSKEKLESTSEGEKEIQATQHGTAVVAVSTSADVRFASWGKQDTEIDLSHHTGD